MQRALMELKQFRRFVGRINNQKTSIDVSENDLMILVRITGYIAHKQKKNCRSYLLLMTLKKDIEFGVLY